VLAVQPAGVIDNGMAVVNAWLDFDWTVEVSRVAIDSFHSFMLL